MCVRQGLEAVERLIATTAGAYCFGDTLTLADVYLVPQVYNGVRFGVDIAKYPTISRVVVALKALPAFIAADPDNQPDKVAA